MSSEKVNKEPYDALASVSAAWFQSGAIMILFALAFYVLGVASIISKLIWKSWLPSPRFLNISLIIGIVIAYQLLRQTFLKRFPAGRYKMTRNETIYLWVVLFILIGISLAVSYFTKEKLFSVAYGFNRSDPLQLFLVAMGLSLYASLLCIRLKSYKTLYATIFSIVICILLFIFYSEDGWKANGVLQCFIFPSMIMINGLTSMKQFKKTYPIIGHPDNNEKGVE